MAYRSMPQVVRGTSPVLVVGAVTGTVLAAPGAGLRYRLVAVSYMLTRAAAGNVELNLQDSSIIAWFRAGLSYNSSAFAPIPIPEPGFSIAINSALTLQAISTSATGTAEAWVEYFVDAVS